jgi:hypothetical protein
MWQPGRLCRTTKCPPSPRLVSRLRPRLAILAGKDELLVVWATRGHAPDAQIRNEWCKQPHSPVLPRLRVGFLAERDRALNQDGPPPNITPSQPERFARAKARVAATQRAGSSMKRPGSGRS